MSKFLNQVSKTNAKAVDPEAPTGGSIGSSSILECLCAYNGSDLVFSRMHQEIAHDNGPSSTTMLEVQKDCAGIYRKKIKEKIRKSKYTEYTIKTDFDIVLKLITITLETYMKFYETQRQPSSRSIYKHIGISDIIFRLHYEDLYMDFREYLGEGLAKVEKNGTKRLKT